jgi:outer membrane murein-binding lipoprotein Lpp
MLDKEVRISYFVCSNILLKSTPNEERIMGKYIKLVILAIVLTGALAISGCTKYASDEDLKQLNDLKAQVKGLEDEIAKLKADKATLEKSVAEKNGKLKQCQSDQEAVKKAMGK